MTCCFNIHYNIKNRKRDFFCVSKYKIEFPEKKNRVVQKKIELCKRKEKVHNICISALFLRIKEKEEHNI